MVEKIKATDGAVFRQLRHNHQLTLAQVADDHNSIAVLVNLSKASLISAFRV